mmetsp:Transcript_7453/g.14922  ORF Transcript_7453/g.14922 Transcript_7453/m.14922 type:complete len:203 (+) Transcript_7453:49-657(+)
MQAIHWMIEKLKLAEMTVELEECPVCCETAVLIVPESRAGAYMQACSHAACKDCWKRWIESQLMRCSVDKQLRAACMFCPKSLPQRMVFEVSPAAVGLAEKLETRFQLQESELYPAYMQVDCKQVGCVGIGYLGFDRVMCFICQEQWDADAETIFDQPCAEMNGVKACPKCGVLIAKNGGCDHMTCTLCKHEWWWSTGKPLR